MALPLQVLIFCLHIPLGRTATGRFKEMGVSMSYLAPVDQTFSTVADRAALMNLLAQALPTKSQEVHDKDDAERMFIHVVSTNQLERASKARLVFALGHHAEVYEDIDEFVNESPDHGLVLVAEDGSGTARALMEKMTVRGLWFPVVGFAASLDYEVVVEGIKGGVVNYIIGDEPAQIVIQKLRKAYIEGQATQTARLRRAAARRAITSLSRREAEVLRYVTAGLSNKETARELGISPRTVEIHRMKMMAKLGAKTSAQAIRVEIEAAGLV